MTLFFFNYQIEFYIAMKIKNKKQITQNITFLYKLFYTLEIRFLANFKCLWQWLWIATNAIFKYICIFRMKA
jgi:hypothetical protein